MDYRTLFLVLAALLPAVVLCVYIYKKDHVEKEPPGLLFLLLVLGALSCFPAGIFEGIILDGITTIFLPFTSVDSGQPVLNPLLFSIYQMCRNFLGIAFVEEGLKWLILYVVTRKNTNFTHLFDGLIYAIFVSLGFAALENVLYVTDYGFGNAIVRAAVSVPGHMFDAVFMGYYYSLGNIYSIAGNLERSVQQTGLIQVRDPISSTRFFVLSLLIPVLAHGFFDYALSMGAEGSWGILIVFLIFVIVLYIYCFSKIRNTSLTDVDETQYALYILLKKYPVLKHHVGYIKKE